MAHRRIAGDVHIYLEFALKVTHPIRKRRFWQISLNSASAVRASETVECWLIECPQCAFHRAISELCALLRSPQRVAQNENFSFGIAFDIFIAGSRRHFKFGICVEHSKFQPMDDKLSLKGAWSLSPEWPDVFNFSKISDSISKTVQDSLIVSIKFE